MHTGNIGQILINSLKVDSGSKQVQLTTGQVINVRVKEVAGDTALLSYQGQEIVAKLEADIPQGQQLRCLVAGENNGQVVLKVLNSDQEILTPAAVKNILNMLGLQDDEINKGLIGQMVKMEMPLSPENARLLSAFIHTQKIPLQDVGIPVFIQSQGLPLTAEMFAGVKALLTDTNFLAPALKELLAASSLAVTDFEMPVEQKQLFINLSQAIRSMQIDSNDTAETAVLKLTNLFYQLVSSSGSGRTAGQAGGLPSNTPQTRFTNQPGQAGADSEAPQTGPGGLAGLTRIEQTQPSQIQAGQIQAGQIQAGQIQAGQIQAGQIQPGQIQPSQIQPGQIEPAKAQALTVQTAGEQAAQAQAVQVQATRGQTAQGQTIAGPTASIRTEPVQSSALPAELGLSAASTAQAQPAAGTPAQSQHTAAQSDQRQPAAGLNTQRPVAGGIPGSKINAPVTAEPGQMMHQVELNGVRPADSELPPSSAGAGVDKFSPGSTQNVDPKVTDFIIKRLLEAAQKDRTLDTARKEQFVTRLMSILDPAGEASSPQLEVLPVLNNLIGSLSQKADHENNDLLKLAQNVMDKLDMLRGFNTKVEPGRDNMLVMYSSVRFEDREEPLSLFVNYRYDGKNKQRDFNSCRMEVKLQTPNLGLVRCEVQVNYKTLNLQFTCDNEMSCKLVDSLKESLVEKLRQMDYQVTTGASKLDAAKEGPGLWLNDIPDKPGLFKINLRV